MRKIVITTVWALLLAGIGSLFVFANKKQGTETCRSLNVMIEYNGADPLIDESYLIKLITKEGIRIKGQPLKSIPAIAIEELLNNDPYISKSSVRIGVDGIVNIFAKQRIPLVKIVSDNGKTFYLDMEGAVMPLNPGFPARVMVATGHIKAHVPAKEKVPDRMNTEPMGLLSTDLQKVYVTARALNADAFTRALSEQLYINSHGEAEIIPKIGEQIILLGDTTRLAEKIENLNIFYKRGMQADNWSDYHSISLKYRDQVICTKTTKNGSI